jgi:hypothetical protein
MRQRHMSNDVPLATVVALLGWLIAGFGAGFALGSARDSGVRVVCAETCAPDRTPEPTAFRATTSTPAPAADGTGQGAQPVRAGPRRDAPTSPDRPRPSPTLKAPNLNRSCDRSSDVATGRDQRLGSIRSSATSSELAPAPEHEQPDPGPTPAHRPTLLRGRNQRFGCWRECSFAIANRRRRDECHSGRSARARRLAPFTSAGPPGEATGPEFDVVSVAGANLHTHHDVVARATDDDEPTAGLLLRREREHAVTPRPECRKGRNAAATTLARVRRSLRQAKRQWPMTAPSTAGVERVPTQRDGSACCESDAEQIRAACAFAQNEQRGQHQAA